MSDLTAVAEPGQMEQSNPVVDTNPTPNGANGNHQPATETNPNGQAAPTAPSPAPGGVPEGEEAVKDVWDGNPNSLPEPMRDHGKAVQRYVTKLSMETAEARKLADQFKQFQNSDNWKSFQAFQASQANRPAPQPTVTDIEEALSTGDPVKLEQSIQRRIAEGIEKAVQQYAPVMGDLQTKMGLSEKQAEIEAAADLYPDFWQLYDDGILMPMVQSIVDTGQGGTIHDAVTKAREISSKYEQRAMQKSQGRVLEKKKSVTSTPSPAQEIETVYAADRTEALKLAFENAWNKKSVNVRTKK